MYWQTNTLRIQSKTHNIQCGIGSTQRSEGFENNFKTNQATDTAYQVFSILNTWCIRRYWVILTTIYRSVGFSQISFRSIIVFCVTTGSALSTTTVIIASLKHCQILMTGCVVFSVCINILVVFYYFVVFLVCNSDKLSMISCW